MQVKCTGNHTGARGYIASTGCYFESVKLSALVIIQVHGGTSHLQVVILNQ